MNRSDKLIDYISYHLTYRKAKKSNRFYRSLIQLYTYNPYIVYDFIDNVNKLGYYKDLIHIFCRSSNNKLNDYILNTIITIIRNDLICLGRNEKTTTMGKWLPKENGSSDKKCGFVKIFCKLYFGGITNNHLKQYRLMRSRLNRCIGTLECKMCAKEYNTIDFNKIGVNALTHNMNALIKHPELKDKIIKTLKTKDYKLPIFIEKVIKGKMPKSVIKNIYEMYRFIDNLPNHDYLKSVSRCIINMSSTMFSIKAHYLAIGTCLELKRMNNNIEILVINYDRLCPVKFDNDNLFDNINTLLSYCCTMGPVTIPSDKKTLVISNNEIKDHDNVIQYKQTDDTNVDIICGSTNEQYSIRNTKHVSIKDFFNKYKYNMWTSNIKTLILIISVFIICLIMFLLYDIFNVYLEITY